MFIKKNIRVFLLIIHLLIGFLVSFDWFTKGFSVFVFMVAMLHVFKTKNNKNEAFFWSAYIVGSEVLFRMSGGLIFYELSKYSVLIILFFGLLIEKYRKNAPVVYIVYILLLLVGIAFTEVPHPESIRKAVAFNLSGPILLGVSAIYFFKRRITQKELFSALFFMLLPIISMLVHLYLNTPDLKDLIFNTQANFALSGGFGPNQVATILGLGIFICFTFVFNKTKFSGLLILDIAILLYLIYRCFFTFSRGGLITAIVAIFVYLGFYLFHNKKNIMKLAKILVLSVVSFFAIFFYVSNLTGGMLEKRFTGKNARGVVKEDVTSGRVEIFKTDLDFFYKNPIFGIGVGSGKYKRLDSQDHVTAASHNEVSRLFSEHGIIGVLLLVLLLFIPIRNVFDQEAYLFKGLLLAFYFFWFLTINHSAMRIAFPAFIYGLSLIKIIPNETSMFNFHVQGDD